MASTYSDLKIELIGTGEQSGTWGTTTNTNLGTAIEEAITGSADVSFSDADVTLTLTDTNTTQAARNLRLNLTGTATSALNLIVPAIEKLYLINNGLAETVTVKNSSGTGAAVPAGKSMFVFNNGTNVALATNNFNGSVTSSSVAITGGQINGTTLGGATPAGAAFTSLSASSTVSGAGFTNYFASPPAIGSSNPAAGSFTTLTANGATTLSGAITSSSSLDVTGTFALDGSQGTSGQVLVSQGSGNTPAWGNAFVAGMIMMWSGTIATIPSGWYLCDGNNSTPDLRNKFIIGAYSDDAGAAKTTITGSATQSGGSKDAIVVSHTHTATVTDPGHDHDMNAKYAAGGDDPTKMSTAYSGGASFTNTTAVVSNTTGISVSNSTTGSSGTNANLPPYYALAFIMKG